MYYSTKTGERADVAPPIPLDAQGNPVPEHEIWVELPADYDWRTWDFAHLGNGQGYYYQKEQAQIDAQAAALAARRIEKAWVAADAFAQAGFDSNSRFSMLDLDRDPNCPEWRKSRINDVKAWWAAIWAHYEATRASIQSGNNDTFDPQVPGDCPWTIWDIARSTP